MSSLWENNSGYDWSANNFSPEGRIFQVEYAIQAIKLGSTAIGIQTKQGVVLVTEKRLTSKLIEPSSVEKVFEIDDHIGCAMSGLIAMIGIPLTFIFRIRPYSTISFVSLLTFLMSTPAISASTAREAITAPFWFMWVQRSRNRPAACDDFIMSLFS